MELKTSISDENLMLAVKKGEISKLADLFERYSGKIYQFFYRLTLDKHTSEDLTQQVFYRIAKYRLSYREEAGYFRTWIYQMARNLYYNHQKAMGGIPVQLEEDTIIERVITDEKEGYSQADFDQLDAALMQLDDMGREILIMSRYQQLKYEEIARIVGKTVPAIKVIVHRSIKKLREIYFKEE